MLQCEFWRVGMAFPIGPWAPKYHRPYFALSPLSLLPPSPAASYICFTLTTKSTCFDNKYYHLLTHNGSNIQPGKINDVDEIGEKIHPRTPLRYTENGPGGDLLRQIVNRRRSLYAGTSPKRPALLWQEQGQGTEWDRDARLDGKGLSVELAYSEDQDEHQRNHPEWNWP